jgi:hypothetical protein
VGNTTQKSKETANSFSSPVVYKVTSGDGEKTSNWTVTITGGKPGGNTASFQKKTFSSFRDFYDFIPQGVFQIRGMGTWDDLIGKCADGSLTMSEISSTASGQWEVGDIAEYRVWKGANFYRVFFSVDDETKKTQYFTHKGEFTSDKTLGTSDKVGYFSTATDWNTGNISVAGYGAGNVLSGEALFKTYTAFITSNDCETATFEKNDAVAGIPCKKYVKGAKEWWVLDNGFCLKYVDNNINSDYGNPVLHEVVKGSLTAPDADAVLRDYYKDPDITSPPTPLAEMPHTLICKEAAMVATDGWVVPWTAGNINFSYSAGNLKDGMVRWVIMFQKVVPVAQQVNEYIDRVMQIPNMVCTYNNTKEYSILWEGNNSCLTEGVTCTHQLGDVIPTIHYEIYMSFDMPSDGMITITKGSVEHL